MMDYSRYQEILKINDLKLNRDTLILFLKEVNLYNKKQIERINNKTRYFNINDHLFNPPIGCYYDINNSKITSYKLSLPNIEDALTFLINIHETIHALILDSRLNELITNICTDEVLPMFYESIFIQKYNNDELKRKYELFLNILSNEYDSIHKEASKKLIKLNQEYINNNEKILEKCKKIVLNL